MRLIFLLFLTLPVSSQIAAASDGNELLSQCSVILEAMDGNKTGNATSREAVDATRCMSFVSGVSQTSTLYEASGKMSKPSVCGPDQGITTSQAVRIAVKYLKEHPQDLHQKASMLVMYSLMDAFPCGTVSKIGR
ncbi:Rap1a/Tai family immunity protein [Luteimonas vadosa]|uniref:Rap1a/Tai family immunity protein n=1 Tax=Luteimonas vadosa TaxID=1165507 RepID=UPI003CD0B8C7